MSDKKTLKLNKIIFFCLKINMAEDFLKILENLYIDHSLHVY